MAHVVVTKSNVLQKVSSLTLVRANSEKSVKPKCVPEKLDFKIYEKFGGLMVVNWFVSTFGDDHYLRQDLKLLATQFCTNLLAAGVIRQIEDVGAPLELLFRADLMYYWAHTESSPVQPSTPGKLAPTAWPPSNLMELVASGRPGAKYTEAELLQQVVMGLKREHRESLDLFSLGKLCSYDQKIKELQEELQMFQCLVQGDYFKENLFTEFSFHSEAEKFTPPPSASGLPPPPLCKTLEGTFWEELEDFDFDWDEYVDEFVDLFARNVAVPKLGKNKAEKKVPKVKVAKVLDIKRSQVVDIFMKSQHLDIADVENAVYNFDASTFYLEEFQEVYEMRGSLEEILMIKSQQEAMPDMPLDKPEQFLLDLSKINQFAERYFCFNFQATFEEDLGVVHISLSLIKNTATTLMKSESIKRICGLILAYGNYMERGNLQRGQADGFGLDILPKLKDVKSNDNTFTLLHFIVIKYIEKYEGSDAGTDKVKPPIPDPYSVERSAYIQFVDIEYELSVIQKNLAECEKRAAKVSKDSDEAHLEPFKGRMEDFFAKAKDDLQKENDYLESCKSQFVCVVKYFYFNFDGKRKEVTPHDFFSVWAPFCIDFMTIWQKEQAKIVKKRGNINF